MWIIIEHMSESGSVVADCWPGGLDDWLEACPTECPAGWSEWTGPGVLGEPEAPPEEPAGSWDLLAFLAGSERPAGEVLAAALAGPAGLGMLAAVAGIEPAGLELGQLLDLVAVLERSRCWLAALLVRALAAVGSAEATASEPGWAGELAAIALRVPRWSVPGGSRWPRRWCGSCRAPWPDCGTVSCLLSRGRSSSPGRGGCPRRRRRGWRRWCWPGRRSRQCRSCAELWHGR
jgi:hypothetical protein